MPDCPSLNLENESSYCVSPNAANLLFSGSVLTGMGNTRSHTIVHENYIPLVADKRKRGDENVFIRVGLTNGAL